MRLGALLAGVVLAIAPVLSQQASAGQETRAAAIAARQEEKARQLEPYTPNKAERIASEVKERLLDSPEGLYPWLESVYSGGGFTLGAGYRRFIGDRTFVDARGLYSGKSYKLAEVAIGAIDGPRRFSARASGGWRDATEVAYYGLG